MMLAVIRCYSHELQKSIYIKNAFSFMFQRPGQSHPTQASTSNPKRPRENDDDQEPIDMDFNPLDDEEEIEMIGEVNDELSGNESDSEVGGARIDRILQHEWFGGELKLQVWWNTEETTWELFPDMKEDYPRLTATYIVELHHVVFTASV